MRSLLNACIIVAMFAALGPNLAYANPQAVIVTVHVAALPDKNVDRGFAQ